MGLSLSLSKKKGFRPDTDAVLQLRGVECSALHPQAIAAGIECRTENSVRPTPHCGTS